MVLYLRLAGSCLVLLGGRLLVLHLYPHAAYEDKETTAQNAWGLSAMYMFVLIQNELC